MGNNPSVFIQTTVASPVVAVPYLNHALVTFVPKNSTFATNFAASSASWMFKDPASLEGLVAALQPGNWDSRLRSLGCPETDPVWLAADAHFNQLTVADANGQRARLSRPDVLYVGRRTRAVASANTFTFATNDAGRVRIRVNPAKFLYTDSSPVGSLADVTVVADGVLTVAQLATAAAAALNALPDFSAHFLAAAALGVVTVTGDVEGYPLILSVVASTPGPTITQAVTTANVAGDYEDDLNDIQQALEYGSELDVPSRKAYWVTDLQLDDVVNAEGMAWAEDQYTSNTPPRDYRFWGQSTSGDRRITIGGNFVGNFDPTSTDSATQTAHEANGGTGWTRGSVFDHDRFEFAVVALLGRTIGYKPGLISFTDKVLYGGTPASRMSPRDFGDNENLTNGDERAFNWYGAEGPFGSARWGYTANGSFKDRKWLEDYVTWQVTTDLIAWKQINNITAYTNDAIAAGSAIIKIAIAKVPAVIADSIGVVSLERDQVNPANIVARVYYDYVGTGLSGGIINKIGTPSEPVPITITDG